MLLIFLLPVIAALPALIGLYDANPMLYVGALAQRFTHGATGIPYIDPNNGFTTQALGYRAALNWLNGTVPWWNYFSGVGLPLAAEYQPAAFFPPTLMLLLPNGMLLQHILLQILAGWGTYGLLRQLGLGRLAAVTGGILFAFNGALAWFDHASALPVPFLPWMLWGVERAFAKAVLGARGGWRLFAVALWMGLVAGFPETAYLNGLLALAWSLLRLWQAGGHRLAFLSRLTLGGVVGLALSAPQILAFFEFLPHAWLGAHDGAFAHAALNPAALLPSLFFPYFYGPIFAYSREWDPLGPIWGSIGGYISLIVVIAGLYGAMLRRTALTWLLLIWLLTVLAKSFGIPQVTALWNLIPGVAQAAFFRYAVPTWELAFIILAAQAIDSLRGQDHEQPPYRRHIAVLSGLLVLAGVFYAVSLRHHLYPVAPLRHWALAAILWVTLMVSAFNVVLSRCRPTRAATAIAAILVFDSALMFFIPTLSNPRSGDVDMKAISFLQENLGLQRFYSLGPVQPNYGAYFGIAAINHNYLPVNKRWVDWVPAHLDAYADPISFTGNYRAAGSTVPTPSQELIRNLSNYEWIGVKYVVAPTGVNPFLSALTSKTDATSVSPLQMSPGNSAAGTLPAGLTDKAVVIDRVGVSIGNYNNTSDGILTAEVCVDSACASGQRDLKESIDNATFVIPLNRDLRIDPVSIVSYRFTRNGGSKPLALWKAATREPAQEQRLEGPTGPQNGYGLQIRLQIRDDKAPAAKQVYADRIMTVYELNQPSPYFEDLQRSCRVTAHDREHVTTECSAPSTLLRRELFFPGWAAKVNGSLTPITEHKDLFQAIALPEGKSTIVFRYEPPHMIWAWIAMFVAFGVLILSTMKKIPHERKRQ
ncbi:hypothetical protein FAZ69_04895 [Trinickia terrae]|uniref:YfhO family protein n=1 Tax=Trinickia terrae TaxID=2571161 RepID=A0A4U1IDW6_9BURK|nr:hypothetical protein FAZ69_04895 [Trinickia terrae]